MSAAPSHWTFAAIVLLVGAKLVVDPDGFSTLGEGLSEGIRNFELRARGMDNWRLRRLNPRFSFPSPSKRGARIAGCILIAFGLFIGAVS